ncbi:MAG: hypothetical protein P8Y65_05710 [Campylobacterales bacterium]
MIYSHKTDNRKRNLSHEEITKLRKLQQTKPTSWMIDKAAAVS